MHTFIKGFGIFLLIGFLWLEKSALAQEETFSKDDRDQKIEYFGADHQVHDRLIEFPIETIPASYGRLVAVHRSPFNPKERELWFEGNDGVVRQVVLVPIENRVPPYMIYQQVLTLERD